MFNKLKAITYLTNVELRPFYRRFGHLAIDRLCHLLEKTRYKLHRDKLQAIAQICHHCQMNDAAPRQLKFNLKDNYNFNYKILVDIMYLNNCNILHVVDSFIAFQRARFLPLLSAKEI